SKDNSGPSYSDQVRSLKGSDRDNYRMTGKLPGERKEKQQAPAQSESNPRGLSREQHDAILKAHGNVRISAPAWHQLSQCSDDPSGVMQYLSENPDIAEHLEEKSAFGKTSDEYRYLLSRAHVDPHVAAQLKLAHDNARQILDYVKGEIENDPKTK